MKEKTFKQRVAEAAEAYLERSELILLQIEYPTPDGVIPILAVDGDVLVRVAVDAYRPGKAPKAEKPPSDRTIAKHVKQMDWAAELMRVNDVSIRFDTIRLMVLSEDRALLRHHKGAYAPKEAGHERDHHDLEDHPGS